MHQLIRLSLNNFVNISADTAPGDDVRYTIVELNEDKLRCRLNSEHGAHVNHKNDA